MAIGRISYLQISREKRREAALPSRRRLQERLSDPTLTVEQRATLVAQLEHLAAWEAGTLGAAQTDNPPAVALPPRTTQNHSVRVSETVEVKDHA